MKIKRTMNDGPINDYIVNKNIVDSDIFLIFIIIPFFLRTKIIMKTQLPNFEHVTVEVCTENTIST